ncbi:MAG: hypothetical protein HY078_14125 [Elusimicrobia bacterium]|nr:hypothetical protein [Elusimicrobiota bacterium]
MESRDAAAPIAAPQPHPAAPAPVSFLDRVLPIVAAPCGISDDGYPHLSEDGYRLLRDTIPYIPGAGERVLKALDAINRSKKVAQGSFAFQENISHACAAARSYVESASIACSSDLWLLGAILRTFRDQGFLGALLTGEALRPETCLVSVDGRKRGAIPGEIEIDLLFLASRGLLEPAGGRQYVLASHPRARSVLEAMTRADFDQPAAISRLWRGVFSGERLSPADEAIVTRAGAGSPMRSDWFQDTWLPTFDEIELHYRLLPVVIGLRAAGRIEEVVDALSTARSLAPRHESCADASLRILSNAGVVEAREPRGFAVTQIGKRILEKGPGPMGIIEAYHPYLSNLPAIWAGEKIETHVRRGDDISASQDANRVTFIRANDCLDAFCHATGFAYSVFIEHAAGRGEAIRQRFARSGGGIAYVAADFEDESIQACLSERDRGGLPASLAVIGSSDIGAPGAFLQALQRRGIDSKDAVMIVGNGFQEVRGQTDESMSKVFKAYHDAGIVLIFIEESALSIDDLLETGWSTYHAGFRYVHERSGQVLRPSEDAGAPRVGPPLRTSWHSCAAAGGYVRLERFSRRSRPIYPWRPKAKGNPSISVTHFCVPRELARRLKLGE